MNKLDPRWYKNRIGYIIYPSSFYDSNGDGVGDIPGIIAKLDYLVDLGVNLVWICPLFDSPMDDNGYDVKNYLHINPLFGTDDDFRRLIEEAHKRDIAVIIDFVLNHTSDEHPWFLKALEDPNSKERGYYLIRKGKNVDGKLMPPNNWKGYFSESVWTRIEGTDDYFFHIFSSKMPDVDWSNPALRDEYVAIGNAYMEMGVDGFRLDACAHLAKDLSFEDSKAPLDKEGLAFEAAKFSNRDELYDYLEEMKERVFAPHHALTIGECGGDLTPEKSLRMTNRNNGSINMVFNFDTVWVKESYPSWETKNDAIKTNIMELKTRFLKWYDICHQDSDMPVYWCNHDHPRAQSMYGDSKFAKASAKTLFSLLLFMYGVPFIYQGDELGMTNFVSSNPEDFFCDVKDKNEVLVLRNRGVSDQAIANYLSMTSRVSSRQPFPWNNSENGGFSTVKPLFPSNKEYMNGINAEDEKNDPDSVFNFVKEAIEVRKHPAISKLVLDGRFELLDHGHPDVFSYIHHGEGERLVVIASMRDYECYFGFYWTIQDVLLHNYSDTIYENHVFKLRPYECFVLRA